MTKQRHEEFTDFARARTPHLYRSAWLLCGDRHEAEDLVQETLGKVFAKWGSRSDRTIDNPAAYAQTTLTRTFLSSRRRRSSTEQPFAEPPERSFYDDTPDTDVRIALLAALAELEPADRAVLVLRYLDDLSVQETAQQMNTSQGAVRTRSMRALDKVRPLLGDSTVFTA